jgi:sulfatase maturation enzyme AslB (radical SAM superfamily)
MSRMRRIASQTVCGIAGGAMNLLLGRFPPVVRVETTNACNARCTICPHRAMKRPIRKMDEGLFARIIDECAAAGCRELHLHNFGEPLLDDRLADRIRAAKRRGIARIKIFSNGSLLDQRRARDLIAAGLDEIKISFDGASAEEYERIRVPLKFDRVVENIAQLVVLRNQMRSAMKIRVACCSTSDKQATMRTLEKLVDGFSFGKIHNWTGTESSAARQGIRKPCSRLWRTLTVLAGGEVALCCLDYDGGHLLGRIDEGSSLADVWRGAAYREVRRRHLQGRQAEIALCANCSKAFV